MPKHALWFSTCLLALLPIACDVAKQADARPASEQANATIAARDLELATVVTLVERDDVRDAESLEALINAEDSTIKVDVDADGTRDFVQVHELGEGRAVGNSKLEAQADPTDGALRIAANDGDPVTFELRAVPSSQITEVTPVEPVVVATVDIELREADQQVVVEARYAPSVVVVANTEVERVYVHRIDVERRHDHWVVLGSPFVAWVWIDARPVYWGHAQLPPGHAKKLGLDWRPEHAEVHAESKGKARVKSKRGRGKH